MKSRTSKVFVYSGVILALSLLMFGHLYEEALPRRRAREIWKEHERVVVDAAEGRHVASDDLWEAGLFFWRLAGINVSSGHSSVIDAMPTKDTGRAVGPIRRWYKVNKYRLYYDDEHKEVRLGRKNIAPWAVLP